MTRDPKLNALRVFDAAARHLNFRAAAVELHVTQGAVAQTIRGLEADLGLRLFERLPRGVALTEVGNRYYAGVSKGLTTIARATEELRRGSNSVTVSVPPSFASKWLVRRLPYFLEVHPNIEVKIIATEAITDFQTQGVDIAVRQGPEPGDRGIVFKELAPARLCIVRGKTDHFEATPIKDIAWFKNAPLIQDSHHYWDKLFDRNGITSSGHHLSFNQTALAIDAALGGQGFAIVPRFLAMDDLASGRLFEAWSLEDDMGSSFWAVHPKEDRPNRRALSAFLDWLCAEAANT